MKELTQELLKELLHYDPETGVFTWKRRDRSWFKTQRAYSIWNTKFSGKIAGSAHKSNKCTFYKRTSINSKKLYLHRAAWLYVYGVVPIGIDHINGNSLDNRIKNLRNVPQTENTKNLKIPTSNTSGVHGVYWSKVRSKWIAGIGICGKTYYLGGFTDIEEAKKARKDAEKEHGFHENHGRKS